jgi:membrane protease YdiL (CAAX protease family)
MADYNRESFDDRVSLTTLRTDATKQVIVLALALIAVPTSIVGLGVRLGLGTSLSAVYWTLNVVGILAAIVSVAGGGIFLLSAPNWAKNKERETILDYSYVVAPVGMIVSALFVALGTLVAIFAKIVCQ